MPLQIHPLRALYTFFGYQTGTPPRVSRGGTKLSLANATPGQEGLTYQWFKNETQLAADRMGRYREYDSMDSDDILSSALDLYSEDATQPDMSTGRSIWIESKNEEIKKIAEEMLLTVGMEDRVFLICRSMAKYGDHFEAILQATNEAGFPVRIAGLKAQQPHVMRREQDVLNRLRGFTVGAEIEENPAAKEGASISQPWDFVHWRLLSRVDEEFKYGTSIIAPARQTYRYLRLMEESMAIYRIRRNPDRLKWMVDVGDATPGEAAEILNTFRQVIRKRMLTDPSTGEVRSEMNPLAMDEDLYIPTSQEYTTNVELMKGSNFTDRVLDIEYMRKKLFGCLRIPADYLGFADASGSLTGMTPLSSQDIRFARGVKRLQKSVMVGVMLLVKIDLILRGINIYAEENQFTVLMHPVSHLDELQQAETANVRARIVAELINAGQALGVGKSEWLKYVSRVSGFPEEILGDLAESVTFRGTRGIMEVKEEADKVIYEIMMDFRILEKSFVHSKDYAMPFELGNSSSQWRDDPKKCLVEAVTRRRKEQDDETG